MNFQLIKNLSSLNESPKINNNFPTERVYDRDHYNRGWKKNFRDVMGQNLLQWLCPIAPSKLTAEQEPLIVTVTEQTSNNW